ncbi:MAG: glycosyltransferase family 4 protein [Tannerella sp.]|jgi:glycosyltransferase involved in cell wall biosynthesis|nr:glycosyltransferase family 4 protein [Tannerella sp.]
MKITVTGLRGIPGIQGGIETHCEELYPRLVKLGCDVTLLRRKPFIRETPPFTSWKGVKLKDMNAPTRMGVEALVHTLKGVWHAFRTRAEILHIHAIGPSVAVPFARLLGLRVVVTHHGPDYNRLKWGPFARFILRTGERFAAWWADDIIVISTVIRDLLRDRYGRTAGVHLIYNGVNRPEPASSTDYIRSLGLTPGKYILAVGRFVEEKNFDKLVRACATMSLPEDCRLAIAGAADHPTPYSDALAKRATDSGAVLAGMIKGASLHELYTHARLFVLPSSHEGLPFTLLEAMSYRLDVLVSDIPAHSAVNLPPDCYFHCGEGDIVPALCKAMEAKLSNPPATREYDLSPYDWDTIARQTLDVYSTRSEMASLEMRNK